MEPTIFGLLISALFTENFVLVKFLGCCPFLGVSKKLDTAVGMGMAVTFVMAIASMMTYLVNEYILVPLGAEYLHGPVFIFMLAAFILTFHHNSAGQVGDANGTFRFVYMLAASTGGTEGIYFQVVGVQLEINLAHLRQNRDSGGAGVYPASGLGDGNTLHPVASGFKLEP